MTKPDSLERLNDLVRAAKAAGADAADALLLESGTSSVSYRMGRLEDVERAESTDLGLRVFVGQRIAFVSSTDLSKDTLASLPERAVAMARLAPEDKFAMLAPPELLAREFPDLDIADAHDPSTETLVEWARSVEGAALAVSGVTNSEGGGASFDRSVVSLVTSTGFAGQTLSTSASIGVAVLAGEGTGMERDYASANARHTADLESREAVGERAGHRAVRRLNPRKAKSQSVPVVYDPRVSSGLLGHLAGAISGTSIARGVSFLKDAMGQQIFAPHVTIVDDPHRLRGLRSKPFDGEGVRNARLEMVSKGVLQSWFLDCASARQLGLVTTGHASRGTSGPPSPSPSNLYMAAGSQTRDALIGNIREGFLVTELMGMGVNGVTGDYSRGATGFWIENGVVSYPVSEVTIAGNLKQMFLNLTPASDLEFRHGTNAPTCRVEGMTVAGA